MADEDDLLAGLYDIDSSPRPKKASTGTSKSNLWSVASVKKATTPKNADKTKDEPASATETKPAEAAGGDDGDDDDDEENVPKDCKLVITGMPWFTSDREIETALTTYGNLESFEMIEDESNGKFTGKVILQYLHSKYANKVRRAAKEKTFLINQAAYSVSDFVDKAEEEKRKSEKRKTEKHDKTKAKSKPKDSKSKDSESSSKQSKQSRKQQQQQQQQQQQPPPGYPQPPYDNYYAEQQYYHGGAYYGGGFYGHPHPHAPQQYSNYQYNQSYSSKPSAKRSKRSSK